MFSFLRRIFVWIVQKTLMCVFLVVSLTSLAALWIYLHDERSPELSRERTVATLRDALDANAGVFARNAAKLETLRAELAALNERAGRAGRIIELIEADARWWRRWITDREQQEINSRRVDSLEDQKRTAERDARRLSLDVERTQRELAVTSAEMQRIEGQLRLRENTDSAATHYLDLAWWRVRWYVLAAVLLDLVGPTLRLAFLYYFVAPRVAKGRAVRLARKVDQYPSLGETRASLDVVLWPGEVACVRQRYLVEADDGLVRRDRLFLSWRFPFTSLFSGFVRAVDLRNPRAGRQFKVRFADRKHPSHELAVVHVPPGGSLVVRPSYVSAVIRPLSEPFRMRRRWQLFRWQSWMTAQFRYFEFRGPCRLVIAGRRGLKGERLVATAGDTPPSLQTSRDRTIGFTPNLEYRLVRTMRFWNYYQGDNALFDAHFTGVGFVLIRSRPPTMRPRGAFARGWFAVRDRTLKLLGL